MNLREELNNKQYEAVTSNSRYLRIIAGAGSGKTRVLTYRIAYLIKEIGIYPSQILAITFTNKVAKEMNERACALISDINKGTRLNIYTFHGFCARFLRAEIETLGITRNFIIYDEEDKTKLIKNIAVDLGYKKGDQISDDVLNFIGYHKTKGELPADFSINNSDPKQVLLLKFFEEYEKRKNAMFALDFDDLLIYAIKILETSLETRIKYINRFKHILIDEFQDTNNVQYKLLRLLSGENTCIYVVGDPDQTIYTWRGADQKIILDIEKDYSPMETIILNENYRSTQHILNHANKLIAHNKERIKKDLFTENNNGDDVNLRVFVDGKFEANFVSKKINELRMRDKTLRYQDICILYRSSFLSLNFEKSFAVNQIPYTVYGGIKFYSRKEIKDVLAYLRIIVNTKDDISFERIINVPRRKIGDKTILILKEEAKRHNLSMIDYIQNIDVYDTEIKHNTISILKQLLSKIENVRKELNTNYEGYELIIQKFLDDIGYFDYLKDEDEEGSEDRIDNVKALIDDIRSFLKDNPEALFIDYLNNISLLSGQDDIKNVDSVSLMTVHTAKGLEFRVVFVVGLAQFIFPNNRAMLERENGLEEERRLCYVAFTRAKEFLYVSYNTGYNFTTQTNNIASQFIEEACIKPSETILKSQTINQFLYSYNMNKPFNNETKKRETIPVNRNVVSLNKQTNGIKWNISDKCSHEAYGEGEVIEINNDVLTVNFKNFGIRKMVGSSIKLKKI